MKKHILLMAIAMLLLSTTFGQWSPTPSDPWKWYKIEKDTVIKGFEVSKIYVCIYQYYEKYQVFSTDTATDLPKSPVSTYVSFKVFSSRAAAVADFSGNCLADFTEQFASLPFGCDNAGQIDNSAIINEFLAKKYNVWVSDITE